MNIRPPHALIPAALLLALFAATLLPSRQWYRRMRGGRWARVTGMFFGRKWVRVNDECVEAVEEDWRSATHDHWRNLQAKEKKTRIEYQDVIYQICTIVDQPDSKATIGDVVDRVRRIRKAAGPIEGDTSKCLEVRRIRRA